MLLATSVNDPKIVEILQAGGIGVLRTDTLYGLVAKADNEQAVERIYNLKSRDECKSPIVLIADTSQLFDAASQSTLSFVASVWPGPVSLILPSKKAPTWIRRQNNSVAYRHPDSAELVNILKVTGPLVAPSANPEGLPPAMDIAEARSYFKDAVDFYVDGGRVENMTASQLIRINENGSTERLR